jgi:hypothetical protein
MELEKGELSVSYGLIKNLVEGKTINQFLHF